MYDVLIVIQALLPLVSLILMVIVFSRISKLPSENLSNRLDMLDKSVDRLEKALRDEIAKNREELALASRQNRDEQAKSLTTVSEALLNRVKEAADYQKAQLDIFSTLLGRLTETNEQKLDKLRETVEARLKSIQEDNSKKLEQMRQTVDEKLHETLEKRLGESFKLVSDRLEKVHTGLGEMQSLAAGVGDLKKVLTNVKTRGTCGEVQLGALLEQMLVKEQYGTNVQVKQGSSQRVEFAIKLPGREEGSDGVVWLPIDAKFPQEDYQRLVEAQEKGDVALVEQASKTLEDTVKKMAKDIRGKYIDPPQTTDFAIMYLPTEGLYAEVLRRTGLMESMQRDFRVTISGPTTLSALLNALQMGFRTLAIEKRASEVWQVLGSVKTEFSNFGLILERTKKQLDTVSKTIDTATSKSRTIERKLRDVQALPTGARAAEIEDAAPDAGACGKEEGVEL